jgi:hypothetical protein
MGSIDERIQSFKRGLTLQLFLQRGPYDDEVSRIRGLYCIDPITDVPPEVGVAEMVPPWASPVQVIRIVRAERDR